MSNALLRTSIARRALLVVGVACSAGLIPRAQSRPPAFEVASVKPNKSGSDRVNIMPQPGGRFTATNVSLMDLITIAYGVGRPFPRSNVLNGPSWLGRDRFDIVAKAEGDPTRDEFSLMLRPLLADRFRLALHSETR